MNGKKLVKRVQNLNLHGIKFIKEKKIIDKVLKIILLKF